MASTTRPKLAAIVTAYERHLHAQHIIDRFLDGFGWNGQFYKPKVDIVSLYVDRIGPRTLAEERARRHPNLRLVRTVEDAITLGSSALAVDGIIAVAEHGVYPKTDFGVPMRPHYEFFSRAVEIFASSGRCIPYFNDKQLSWNWESANNMYQTSRSMNFPLQGGSSLAVTRRYPPLNFEIGVEISEALALGYGPPGSGDFHVLETLQCMVERRAGGEVGVQWLEAFSGDRFWNALENEAWSRQLFEAALCNSSTLRTVSPTFGKVFPSVADLRNHIKSPIAYRYQHCDGLLCTMILLDGFVRDFTFAATLAGSDSPQSTQMYLAMPDTHSTIASFFNPLVYNAEQLFISKRSQYPIERTLLTTGLMISGIESLRRGGERIDTQHLKAISYSPESQDRHWIL